MSVGTIQSITQDGIRIRKGIVVESVPYPTVKMSIESTRDTPVAIRIREDLPDGYGVNDLGFHADYDGHCWRLVADDALEFSRCLAPGDITLTAYTLYGSVEHAQRFDSVPTIDTVAPVDPEDLKSGEGNGPLWRSGSSEAVPVSSADPTDDTPANQMPAPSSVTDDRRANGLVAVPAYNEESSVADIVTQVRTHVEEVIVIDDGSTDETTAAARSVGATVVEHDRNEGYGAALKTAFTEAERRDVTWLAILDGDGQHEPADLPELLERQADENADIVIGSRFVDDCQSDVPLFRRAGLWVINHLTNLSMGTTSATKRIRDTQSGFRVYTKPAIEVLAADSAIGDRMGASLDVLHCARRCGLSIVEVGTTVSYDVENRSAHNPLRHGFDLLTSIFRTAERDHPLTLLGVPGFTSLLLALYVGYTTAISYGQMDLIPPSVLLAFGALFFVGLFSCFAAIIAHVFNLRTPAVGHAT